MTSQIILRREVEKLKAKTGVKPKKQLQVAVSNKLIVDWSKVVERGLEKSVVLVEVE